MRACVCGPECLTAKTWHKAKGGNCLHIHMPTHIHIRGWQSCHNKSRIDSWQGKRLQSDRRQRRLESMPQIWSAHTCTLTHIHTSTQNRMQTAVCNTDLQSCQVTSFAYNSNCILSLISFFFFANLHAKWLGSVLRFKCAPKCRQRLFFAPFICVLNVCSSLSLSQQ